MPPERWYSINGELTCEAVPVQPMTQSARIAVLIALIPLLFLYVRGRLSVSLSETRPEVFGSELLTHKKRRSEIGVKRRGTAAQTKT